MDTGTAGGIEFLILIPLSIAALIAVPVGIFYSVSFWQDRVLMLMVICTVLMLVQLFAEIGPVRIRNLIGLLYGAAVILSEGIWFFVRRRRLYV